METPREEGGGALRPLAREATRERRHAPRCAAGRMEGKGNKEQKSQGGEVSSSGGEGLAPRSWQEGRKERRSEEAGEE